jgi:hypothetical protein
MQRKVKKSLRNDTCDECGDWSGGVYIPEIDDDDDDFFDTFLCNNCYKKFKRRPFIKSTREDKNQVKVLIKILLKREAKLCVVSQGTKRLVKKSQQRKS